MFDLDDVTVHKRSGLILILPMGAIAGFRLACSAFDLED